MPLSPRGAAAVSAGLASLLAAVSFGWSLQAQAPDRARRPTAAAGSPARTRAVVEEYCLTCHDADHEKGGLEL
jgi:mono/diheme cytochrome c family protein